MGSPYFVYAGSVLVDEPTEEFLGVTLAEQCHDGSSEHVAESRFFLSPPRDREQRNTTTIVSAAIGTTTQCTPHWDAPTLHILGKVTCTPTVKPSE